MSELNEQQWAVISERGCEASGLAYDEAAKLLRGLALQKVHGLCIVTDKAARRLAPANTEASSTPQQPAETHSKA